MTAETNARANTWVPWKHAGPTPRSNWVFRDVLVVGAYPWAVEGKSPAERTAPLRSLIVDGNVRAFFCLQDGEELFNFEPAHEGDHKDAKLLPYQAAAMSVASSCGIKARSYRINALEFHRSSILDRKTPKDAAGLWSIVDTLQTDLERAVAGKYAVYVHCHGGGGRTKLVVGGLLSRLCGMSFAQACATMDDLWSARVVPVKYGLTRAQRPFLRSAIDGPSRRGGKRKHSLTAGAQRPSPSKKPRPMTTTTDVPTTSDS